MKTKKRDRVTIDWRLLYKKLDEQRRINGISWRWVAKATGLPASSSFTRLRSGKSLSAEAFAACLYWLDRDVLDFMLIPPSLERVEA